MIEVVCGVIEDDQGRFLACRRPAHKHLGGLWEFPGGKVEPAESPAAALGRELLEELGIDVEVGERMTPVEWCYPFGTIRLSPYRCRILGGRAAAIEHDELRWCPPGRLSELDWAAADLPVLAELMARAR